MLRFKMCYIPTPLGEMVAISDNDFLYMLDFTDTPSFESRMKKLQIEPSICGSKILTSITKELATYFDTGIATFLTPIKLIGTEFQKAVWQALLNIPYGHTKSYKQQAHYISNPKAIRAVGSANGKNNLSIIVPCHRVINDNGKLGGYGGGLKRKEWLLQHEQNNKFIK